MEEPSLKFILDLDLLQLVEWQTEEEEEVEVVEAAAEVEADEGERGSLLLSMEEEGEDLPIFLPRQTLKRRERANQVRHLSWGLYIH